MGIISVSAIDIASKKVVLQWKIMNYDPPGVTFKEFFNDDIKPLLKESMELSKAYIGLDKHNMDETDVSLPLGEVTRSFGSYVKYMVMSPIEVETQNRQDSAGTRNAFDILLQSQRALLKRKLPSRKLWIKYG